MRSYGHSHIERDLFLLALVRTFRHATGKIKTAEYGFAFIIARLEELRNEGAEFFLHSFEMNDEPANHSAPAFFLFLAKFVKPHIRQGFRKQPELFGKSQAGHGFVLFLRQCRAEDVVLPAGVSVPEVFAETGYFIRMIKDEIDRKFYTPGRDEVIDAAAQIPR